MGYMLIRSARTQKDNLQSILTIQQHSAHHVIITWFLKYIFSSKILTVPNMDCFVKSTTCFMAQLTEKDSDCSQQRGTFSLIQRVFHHKAQSNILSVAV